PEYEIHGNIGLGLTILFQGDNEYSKDSDLPKDRYIANDIYSNVEWSYSFNSIKLLISLDLLSTLDTSSIPKFDISSRELYFSYHSDNMELIAGHIFIEWSLLDFYSLTNYFNPLTSNLYSGQLMEGINGLHAKFFFPHLSLEFVILPLFTESELSTSRLNPLSDLGSDSGQTAVDDATDTDGEEESTQTQNPVEDDNQIVAPATLNIDSTPPSYSIKNTQIGFRYGLTLPGIDFYLVYFHGYYNEFMISVKNKNSQLNDFNDQINDPSDDMLTGLDEFNNLSIGTRAVNIERIYRIIDSVGFSTSFSAFDITFTGESKITFNMPVIYEREVYIKSVGVFTDLAMTKAQVFQYSVGINYEFWDFRLIAEFSDLYVFDNIKSIRKDLLPGDTVFGLLNYTLTLDFVEFNFSQGAHYDYIDKQLVVLSYITTDFQNGLYLDTILIYLNDFKSIIDGEDVRDGMFGPYNNSFILEILLYYEF
ncbi:MAG: hypothetical protein ACOCV8_03165, partial [Spirochaetota bacterium]